MDIIAFVLISNLGRPQRNRSKKSSTESLAVNNVLSGAEKMHKSAGLMESIMSGGGKITSWRVGGKIRTWSRFKFILRVKAVAKQIQESLQVPVDATVALCFHQVDLDFITAVFGCLMAGVNVISGTRLRNISKSPHTTFSRHKRRHCVRTVLNHD